MLQLTLFQEAHMSHTITSGWRGTGVGRERSLRVRLMVRVERQRLNVELWFLPWEAVSECVTSTRLVTGTEQQTVCGCMSLTGPPGWWQEQSWSGRTAEQFAGSGNTLLEHLQSPHSLGFLRLSSARKQSPFVKQQIRYSTFPSTVWPTRVQSQMCSKWKCFHFQHAGGRRQDMMWQPQSPDRKVNSSCFSD